MPVFFQLINFVVLLIYFFLLFFYMTQYNRLMNVTLSVCVLVSISLTIL